MNLGASDYSIGTAQSTAKYVAKLVQRARQERVPVRWIVSDLCQKPSRGLFSSKPGSAQLAALLKNWAK